MVTVSSYCLQDDKVKHVKLSDGNEKLTMMIPLAFSGKVIKRSVKNEAYL